MAKRAIKITIPGNAFKYVAIHRSRVEEAGGCACQNCGRTIANVAVVENEIGTRFQIGLDCAKSITALHNPYDLQADEFTMKKVLRFEKLAKTPGSDVVISPLHGMAYVTAPDGKEEAVFILELQKFFPELAAPTE